MKVTDDDFVIHNVGVGRFILVYVGDKPVTTDDGWQITFKKWEILSKQDRLVSNGAGRTCGLCLMNPNGGCSGCPIAEFGHKGCAGTPFEDYVEHVYYGYLAQAKEDALKELKFLQSIYWKSHFPLYPLWRSIKRWLRKLSPAVDSA